MLHRMEYKEFVYYTEKLHFALQARMLSRDQK